MGNITYKSSTGQTVVGSSHAGYANMMANAGFSPVAKPAPAPSAPANNSGGGSGGGSSSSGSSMSTSKINSLYTKYFGREADPSEKSYWTTRPSSELNSALSDTYKQAAGTLYDGSPIVPGQSKTQNQLKVTDIAMSTSDVDIYYQKYFNRPASLAEKTEWSGKKASDLDSALSKTYEENTGIKYDGTPIEPGQTKTQNQIKTDPTLTEIKIPDELAENPYFMQLDDNNKKIISYYWNTLQTENTNKVEAMKKALKQAGEQADPYFKEKINIIKDELARTTGTLEADLGSREKDLMARKTAIDEDLSYNKTYLTTEQQAELARAKDSYDEQILDVQGKMASAGLTSSSIRNRAENKLSKYYSNVVESSNRSYDKQQRDLGMTATRSLADIARQTADFQRQTSEGKTSSVRSAETKLGSKEFANTEYAPLLMGKVSGSILEDKGSDIRKRATALMSTNL